jgi:hypothetical protein
MRVRARVKMRARVKVRVRAKMMVRVVVLRGIAEDRTNELYDRFNDDRITVQKLSEEFFCMVPNDQYFQILNVVLS